MSSSVRIALAAGLLLTAVALAVVLSGSRPVVAGTNSIPAYPAVTRARGGTYYCQPGGTVPAGTNAIRLSASANIGPRMAVEVSSGGVVVSRGERPAGWGVLETVTVPVTRVARAIPGATVCITFGPAIEPVQINGAEVTTKNAAGETREAVRLRLEYLRPGPQSWWSLASSVARRMGFGHWPGGTWVAFVLIAIMLAIAALASRLVLRELG